MCWCTDHNVPLQQVIHNVPINLHRHLELREIQSFLLQCFLGHFIEILSLHLFFVLLQLLFNLFFFLLEFLLLSFESFLFPLQAFQGLGLLGVCAGRPIITAGPEINGISEKPCGNCLGLFGNTHSETVWSITHTHSRLAEIFLLY